jgi:hypothetical protein
MDVRHRVGGVAEQVQDDLLELDAVPVNQGEVEREVRLQGDVMPLQITD